MIHALIDPAADVRDEVAAASGVQELPDKIWFHKTAAAVIDAGRCVGCGGCIAACPSRSLTIGADGHPTLVGMCTGCSACWDYCPLAGLRVERLQGTTGVVGEIRAAYSARALERAAAAQDGGAVTALLAALLEAGHIDGAILTRRTSPFHGEAVLATTPEEVREAAGSVYHQGHPLVALNRELPEGVERIAFVGTPCQVSVLRSLRRFPWRYRRTAADAVVLVIGLFCTRSFDPAKLIRSLVAAGADFARVARLDVRDGDLVAHDEEGVESFRGRVSTVRDAALRGCDECADFAGLSADIAVGNLGSDEGRSTVLIRTDAGAEAWALAARAFDSAPLDDLGPLELIAARNLRRAERALARGYDPEGPLWVSYEEHLESYEGTDRAPVAPPAHRSHHYEVSC